MDLQPKDPGQGIPYLPFATSDDLQCLIKLLIEKKEPGGALESPPGKYITTLVFFSMNIAA